MLIFGKLDHEFSPLYVHTNRRDPLPTRRSCLSLNSNRSRPESSRQKHGFGPHATGHLAVSLHQAVLTEISDAFRNYSRENDNGAANLARPVVRPASLASTGRLRGSARL